MLQNNKTYVIKKLQGNKSTPSSDEVGSIDTYLLRQKQLKPNTEPKLYLSTPWV